VTDRPLEGKVALVTGAGRGMGQVIARRLAEDGASVAAHYASSSAGAEATVQSIRALGGKAVVYQADIAKRQDVTALFAAMDRDHGRLDIVVNSSGVSGGGTLAAPDEEQVEWMLGINLKGALFIASEAAKRLGQGGRIINIGSTLAEFPIGGAGVYSATKAALKSFTDSWAKELGKQGVTVNTVIPGATSPGMAERTPEPYRSFYQNFSPFKRIGRAEEVAAVVAFLASEQASWVSGAHIMANGAANA
jgi:3-oxoacyl-[acyl-carrier protein] reductase